MFGKKRSSPIPSMLTPDVIQLIAVASVELKAKNAGARKTWGIGTADRWSADLAGGSISFHFADHSITGHVEVLGSWSSESETWLWAWANESLPEGVTRASAATRAYGEAHGLEALTTRKLARATASLSEDLAAVTVELSGLAGLYHAPDKTGYIFFGLTDFQEVS